MISRLGARLVGIRTTLSGQIAFLLASLIGAISGILIVPDRRSEIIARLGFGMLFIMQNEWSKCREDISEVPRDERGRGLRTQAADHPDQHLLRRESGRRRRNAPSEYLRAQVAVDRRPLSFSDGHLADVKGYAKPMARRPRPTPSSRTRRTSKATDFRVSIQIVGTPDDLHAARPTPAGHGDGAPWLPNSRSATCPTASPEKAMRLFTSRQVLPTLQHDSAYATPKTIECGTG